MQETSTARQGQDGSAQSVEAVLSRHRALVAEALHAAVTSAPTYTPPAPASASLLEEFYGQIEYHQGWRNPDLSPAEAHPGKLQRPTLVLLAAELAAGQTGASDDEREAVARRSVPAAVAVELVHNFSLVHDDIEDGDEERRHRPTLWKLWGMPQAINTGDGIFAIAHLQLWSLPARGVAPATVVQLAELLDSTCVELCEGQYLDMRFEGRTDVTTAMYLEMIGRKTAALMSCAAAMGALLGAPENAEISRRLATFGRALGLGFQLRDDMLGIWSAKELGKSDVGDLRRKKMSLPVIYAMEHARAKDRQVLTAIYAGDGPASEAQIDTLLEILERTRAHDHTRKVLREQCAAARQALDAAADPSTAAYDAYGALNALLAFVAAEGA
ncbi:MAG TPA: polyprenyl synthetase family protein [Ktedonobacterales bacterium]|jgi:geranylgeranyl diphosphate synthase type I|nr:polyprenyl synthetase family protein [Ktedonobacterales bacterium]